MEIENDGQVQFEIPFDATDEDEMMALRHYASMMVLEGGGGCWAWLESSSVILFTQRRPMLVS